MGSEERSDGIEERVTVRSPFRHEPIGRRGLRRRRWLAVSLVALVAMTVVATTTVPAGAAGDPALDRLIVEEPVPGWTQLPASLLQSLSSGLSRTESGITNEAATSAIEGWQGATGGQTMIVALVRFPQNIPFASRNSREGAISMCTSSTGNPPSIVQAFGSIPGAQEAQCSGTTASGIAIAGTSLSWVKGNVIVAMEGVGPPQSEVESVALRQDAAVPADGVQDAGSDTGIVVAVLVGAAAAIALGVTVGLTLRRRTRLRRATASGAEWSQGLVRQTAPGMPAGWMSDPSGQHQLRYWSGVEWTEHVMNNGVAGTDPRSPSAASPTATSSVFGMVSPDGHWFWNGAAWVSVISSDGRMRWDGTRWTDIDGDA